MKNSIYIDFCNLSLDKLLKEYEFAIRCGGRMDKGQKEKYKVKIDELIDSFREKVE